MISHILAFVLLSHLDSVAPEMIEPHRSLQDCAKAAEQVAKQNPALKHVLESKEGRANGAALVCLEVKHVGA